jgi:hypothetical protein
MPAPPPRGCVLHFAGYSNLPIYVVETLSRESFAGDEHNWWYNDPSYHWVKHARAKAKP